MRMIDIRARTRKFSARTLLLALCTLACVPTVSAWASAEASETPRSPRLAALSRALTDGDANALQAFWREIEAAGAPLIEDHASSSQIPEGTMLLTFVVRATGAQNESVPSAYGEFGDTQSPWPVAGPLGRLRGSDVWFRTYEMSDRARFSYHLSRPRAREDHPQAQASFTDTTGTHELFLDPLNTKSYPSAWASKIGSTWIEDKLVRVSYAEGPRAPREPFVAERPGVPRGKVTTFDFASKLLGNERKITIYTPPGADRGCPDCDFLLLFDRASYLTAVPTPTLLDNMLADGVIRPIVAVLVGNTEKPGRGAELPPNPLFQKFLGEELLPWVRARYRYSSDPRRAVVAGSSFGGLASSYTALSHPDVFGNVLSQSGSYWWSPQWPASGTIPPEDAGWLIRRYGEKARLPVRFYMEAGTWEGRIILQPNRQFHSLLQEKGYEVHYEERIGGHDYVSWRATLAEGLQRLIGLADAPAFAGPGNRDCADCPEMVVVPAGAFQMGSPDGEEARDTHEGPLHTVTFAKPFAIGKYEVTFEEWDACVAAQACGAVADDGWGRGRRPVIHVNFEMAMGYAKWLSQKTGQQYRVPSEAEWEYAARGGSTTRWFWGEDSKQACEFANVGDESMKQEHPDWPRHDCNDGYAKTAPVGSFKPNAFGLHDTVGNVWEWVEDCYNPSYEGAPADGRAWLTGDCVRRLDRGGGWYNKPDSVRSALRYAGDDSARRNNTLGFRVVRTLP